MRKALRALFAVATFAVVWLVVSPARAHDLAPVCDPRGAITFAPPPQIQDAELSLDIPADCVEIGLFETRHVVPGRAPVIDLASAQEPVIAEPIVLPVLPFTARLRVRAADRAVIPPGVKTTLDRPPRR
jgi:hypothetical protein